MSTKKLIGNFYLDEDGVHGEINITKTDMSVDLCFGMVDVMSTMLIEMADQFTRSDELIKELYSLMGTCIMLRSYQLNQNMGPTQISAHNGIQ